MHSLARANQCHFRVEFELKKKNEYLLVFLCVCALNINHREQHGPSGWALLFTPLLSFGTVLT